MLHEARQSLKPRRLRRRAASDVDVGSRHATEILLPAAFRTTSGKFLSAYIVLMLSCV